MKKSKFNSDASHLTFVGKLDHRWQIGVFILSFTMPFPGPLSQTLQNASQHTDQRRLFVVYQHDRITVVVVFYDLWLERRIFFFRWFEHFVFLAKLVFCKWFWNICSQYHFCPHTHTVNTKWKFLEFPAPPFLSHFVRESFLTGFSNSTLWTTANEMVRIIFFLMSLQSFLKNGRFQQSHSFIVR